MYETASRDRPVVPEDLRLLLVEDDDGDAFLVDELLLEAGGGALGRAREDDEGRPGAPRARRVLLRPARPRAARRRGPRRSSAAARGRAADVAVVVLTGLADEHRGAAAVAAGAQDYLVKGKVDGPLLQPRDPLRRRAPPRRRAGPAACATPSLRAAENARLERGLLPQPLIARRRPRRRHPLPARPATGAARRRLLRRRRARRRPAVRADRRRRAGTARTRPRSASSLRIAWRALVLAGVPADAAAAGAGARCWSASAGRTRSSPPPRMLVVAPDRRGAVLLARRPPAAAAARPRAGPAARSDIAGPPLGLLPPGAWRGRTDRRCREAWRWCSTPTASIEGRGGRGQERLGVGRPAARSPSESRHAGRAPGSAAWTTCSTAVQRAQRRRRCRTTSPSWLLQWPVPRSGARATRSGAGCVAAPPARRLGDRRPRPSLIAAAIVAGVRPRCCVARPGTGRRRLIVDLPTPAAAPATFVAPGRPGDRVRGYALDRRSEDVPRALRAAAGADGPRRPTPDALRRLASTPAWPRESRAMRSRRRRWHDGWAVAGDRADPAPAGR